MNAETRIPFLLWAAGVIPGGAAAPVELIWANGFGGLFPYTPPEGMRFEMTHMLLVNKYPWDPPVYNAHMRAMYFQVAGMTVTSHHPDVHFDPPYPLSSPVRAWITNGQSEAQSVYGIIQGYLVMTPPPVALLEQDALTLPAEPDLLEMGSTAQELGILRRILKALRP